MTTRAFSGTVRVVVPSCNARQSAPCHSSSSVPVWMSRPLLECGGGVLLAIGAVVAVHTIIEPLYHMSSAASPYSPMWRIMDPLEALAVVLGVIGGSRRTRRVAHDGAAPITREWLAANALFYGFLCVGILCFWNWCNLLRPACTAVGTDTSDVVWGCINAALPLVAGTLGLTLLRGDTGVPRAGSLMHDCRPPSRRGRRRSACVVNGPDRVKSPSRGSLIRQHRGLTTVAGSRRRRRSVGASVVSVA